MQILTQLRCLLASTMLASDGQFTAHPPLSITVAILIFSLRLMSTTEGTIVYYGFREHHAARLFWLSMLTLVFLASTVFPFMDWFNDVKHKVSFPGCEFSLRTEILTSTYFPKGWRIFFFVCIGFTSVAPMAHLAYIYGLGNMLTYMSTSSSFPPFRRSIIIYHTSHTVSDHRPQHPSINHTPATSSDCSSTPSTSQKPSSLAQGRSTGWTGSEAGRMGYGTCLSCWRFICISGLFRC